MQVWAQSNGAVWGILQEFTKSVYMTRLLPKPALLLAKASDVVTRPELKECIPCPCEKPQSPRGPEQGPHCRERSLLPAASSLQAPGQCAGSQGSGPRDSLLRAPGPVSEAAVPVATALPGAVAGIVLPTGVPSGTAGPGDLVQYHPAPWRTLASVCRQSTRFSPRLPPKPKPQVCSLSSAQGLWTPHTGPCSLPRQRSQPPRHRHTHHHGDHSSEGSEGGPGGLYFCAGGRRVWAALRAVALPLQGARVSFPKSSAALAMNQARLSEEQGCWSCVCVSGGRQATAQREGRSPAGWRPLLATT